MIKKTGKGYTLFSHLNKSLGSYKTKKEAEEREKQVNMFKHMNKEYKKKK